MNKFFVIDSVLSRDDYIKIEFSLDEFNWLACLKSEFQYIIALYPLRLMKIAVRYSRILFICPAFC